jgi:hypothetical protein
MKPEVELAKSLAVAIDEKIKTGVPDTKASKPEHYQAMADQFVKEAKELFSKKEE